MPCVNPEIDVVFLVNHNTGETKVVFESPLAGANEASELWWEVGTSNYFLYGPNEFYDEVLRERRNRDNMISPLNAGRRLRQVAIVFGAPVYDKPFITIARTQLAPA